MTNSFENIATVGGYMGARHRKLAMRLRCRSGLLRAGGILALLALALLFATSAARAEPETVYFPSADGTTEIVGYLFRPKGPGPHPAIVLLHGRSGPYSANDNKECTVVAREVDSPCNGATLSKRHRMWGEFWADRGMLVLLPDSFGPRGKARGFGRFTHRNPEREIVSELSVRPLDVDGALAFLRGRTDVVANRIFLQGWSNGGSTTLNVMIRQGSRSGFRAALAFYPGCGRDALLQDAVATSAPLAVFLGGDDEEVSPVNCLRVAERSIDAGTETFIALYPGATHDFDDPGERRQDVPENAEAKAEAMSSAARLVEQWTKD